MKQDSKRDGYPSLKASIHSSSEKDGSLLQELVCSWSKLTCAQKYRIVPTSSPWVSEDGRYKEEEYLIWKQVLSET